MLRPAEAKDRDRIWRLRNDPDTRRASLDTAEIPWDVHARWFEDSLARTDRRIYMIVVGKLTEGIARLDIVAGEAAVSIHLAPERRGQGIGPLALRALEQIARHELKLTRLLASVKADNVRSLSAFKKAGYAVIDEGPVTMLERAWKR